MIVGGFIVLFVLWAVSTFAISGLRADLAHERRCRDSLGQTHHAQFQREAQERAKISKRLVQTETKIRKLQGEKRKPSSVRN